MTIAKNPGTISLQITGWAQSWTYLFVKFVISVHDKIEKFFMLLFIGSKTEVLHVITTEYFSVSVCADQQFGTNFHRICEARTLGSTDTRDD